MTSGALPSVSPHAESAPGWCTGPGREPGDPLRDGDWFNSKALRSIRHSLWLILLGVSLLQPTTASATIHAGSLNSATGPLSVEYNDQAGSLTLHLEVHEGDEELQETRYFTLGPTCTEPNGEPLRDELTGEWVALAPHSEIEGGAETGSIIGRVQLANVGEVTGHGTLIGQTSKSGFSATLTFQSEDFAGQEWACFTLQADEPERLLLGGYPEPEAEPPPPPRLVCFTGHYYVGRIQPRNCLIYRPNANSSEVFDLTHLRWTSWSATRATATGYDLGSHPGMTGSKPYRVRLVASRPGTDPTTGGPMFTRLTEYSRAHPHGYAVRPY
jgi:hypothetical protein